MLRILYSTRIRPPARNVFSNFQKPFRNVNTIRDSNDVAEAAKRTRTTKAGKEPEVIRYNGETLVRGIELAERHAGTSANIHEVESVKPELKADRRRRKVSLSDTIKSDVLGEQIVKPEPKQRLPHSNVRLSDPHLDLPAWEGKDPRATGFNSERAVFERKPKKRQGTSASDTVVFAEGGKRPKRGPIMSTIELSDLVSDKDSIENVGVKLVWSQKDLRRVVTSPYLSKGTRLDDLDPLTKDLFEEYRVGKKKADYKRVNVVSSQLCDDVIERLKPTLLKHIGCDIIDINPGPGVWSAAIHNTLKPRTHVLLEPDYSTYRSHLQPLLDADPSYKLLPRFGLAWNHFQRALSPEFLPHQIELDKDDPRIHEPNNTLLLIANVGYNPRKVYKGFASIAQLFIHQLLSASRTGTLCHKYGRVRMLIWISDEERHLMNPRVLTNRRRATVENEITCEYIEEIASSSNVHEHGYRDNFLKLESSINTLKRMNSAGISTPPHRQSLMEIRAASGEKVPTDRNSISVTRGPDVALAQMEKRFADGEFAEKLENPQRLTPGYNRTPEYYRLNILERRENFQRKSFLESEEQIAELRDLRAKLRSGEIRKYAIPEDRILKGSQQSSTVVYTPEYIRLRILRIRARSDANRNVKHFAYMEEYDAILKLQVLARQPSATQSIKEEAKRRTSQWKDMIFKMPHEQQFSYWLHHNNKIGFNNKPPLLFWDRRRAEPLMVKANEFFPNHQLALMDYQTKPVWPSLQKDFEESWHVMQYLIDSMMSRPTQSLKDALIILGSDCHEWMIAECPSLTDPSKGGNMDPELVRVRIITVEMWREIFEAFQRWPYKPSKYELFRLMGFKEHENDPEVGFEMKTDH